MSYHSMSKKHLIGIILLHRKNSNLMTLRHFSDYELKYFNKNTFNKESVSNSASALQLHQTGAVSTRT
jgi:hypothetical protein